MSPDPPGSIEDARGTAEDARGTAEDASGSAGDSPGSVQDLAQRRSDARGRRDWTAADRLRAEIEAAGWNVIDQGLDFHLEPARPPDVVQDGRVRFGSSSSVPSLLSEPATEPLSVVLLAPERREALDAFMTGFREDTPETSLVVVAQSPDADMDDALAAAEATGATEVLRLARRSPPATAANAGLRRASGSIVVLLDGAMQPSGDISGPLAVALEDPAVALAGAFGLASVDIRRWTPAGPGAVDALGWGALAFRREDFVARGPLDERFQLGRWLGPWWSLMLRDEGPDAPARGALAVPLPLGAVAAPEDGPSLARAAKRDFYRLIDRFGHRYDLLRSAEPSARLANEVR